MRRRNLSMLCLAGLLGALFGAGCQTPLQGMMKQQSPVLGAVDESKGKLKGVLGDAIGEGTDKLVSRLRKQDDEDAPPEGRRESRPAAAPGNPVVGAPACPGGEDGLAEVDDAGLA